MKRIKVFLISFIFLFSSFCPCLSALAQGETWTNSQKTRFFAEGFYKIVTDICGLILPTGLGGQNLQQDYQTYVLNNDWIQSNMTYDEWIASQISGAYINGSSGDSDITFSANLQNSLISWADYYIENNTGIEYAYSFIPQDFRSTFSSQTGFDAFVSLVAQNNYSIRYNSNLAFYIFVEDLANIEFVKVNDQTGYFADAYSNWVLIPDNVSNFITYSWSNGGYNIYTDDQRQYGHRVSFLDSPNNIPSTFPRSCFITPTRQQFVIYRSVDAMRNATQGVKDYYITDSFNTNTDNSITTSYTTTTSNIDNSISYGDVQNYVNNYYVENQSYPSTTVINNYITNYVPSDNGGSGDDNGGSGSDFDWSFLGTIGDFLGGLLQGLGNALSGILSLLTDIIDMFIGEDGLPNTISQLLGYFLNDFLPPEFLQLIELSIVLMVIIGVIKMIRG